MGIEGKVVGTTDRAVVVQDGLHGVQRTEELNCAAGEGETRN